MKTVITLATAAVVAAAAGFASTAIAAPAVNQADAAKLTSYVSSQGLSCMSCHAISAKRVGPAWAAVAQKYKDDPKAPDEVAKRIEHGGSGIWGSIPMPPGMANHAQAQKLAKLILGLAKNG
ncbi:MAG: cytochrome C [Gammaproteobacteria bacterium]